MSSNDTEEYSFYANSNTVCGRSSHVSSLQSGQSRNAHVFDIENTSRQAGRDSDCDVFESSTADANEGLHNLLLGLSFLLFISLTVFGLCAFSRPDDWQRFMVSSIDQLEEHITPGWIMSNVSSVVVFGDSYSAEVEWRVFVDHYENQSRTEWKTGWSVHTAVGGYTWPRWVSWYTGAQIYNYAVGGAVCSTAITPHNGALGIQEHELPSFFADVVASKKKIHPMIETSSDSTVYAMFIGTNDLTRGGFLTQDQAPGKTLHDWSECIFKALDTIFEIGGRNFVLINVVPLDRSPSYSSVERRGTNIGPSWPSKSPGEPSVTSQTEEIVATVNKALKSQARHEMLVTNRYTGARLAYFDAHRLFLDVIESPERFLNGTAAANVTGSCRSCKSGQCERCASPDSFLWFDSIHPSEQVSRIVAREIKHTLEGKGTYAQYWESPANAEQVL